MNSDNTSGFFQIETHASLGIVFAARMGVPGTNVISVLVDINANNSGNVFFPFNKGYYEIVSFAILDINAIEFGIGQILTELDGSTNEKLRTTDYSYIYYYKRNISTNARTVAEWSLEA